MAETVQALEADAAIIIQALTDFYERSISGEGPVIHQPPMNELVADMDLSSLVRDGELTGGKLARFIDEYLSAITRFYHPANIAHQQAVPHYMAALAGLVDNFVSSDGSIYELGPASVSIEYFLINWLLEKVGWNPAPVPPEQAADGIHGGGILTHGGSLANLTAMIAARTRIAPEVWLEGNPGNLVLLAPAEAHYSIARAAGIMGLGHRAVYPLESDEWGIILPDRLPAAYAQVEAEGKQAVALIANACTTAAGLYDPLQEIGEFCRERDLWFHIDGAHGGPALLTEKYRDLMRGAELADSLTMNMHKLMRVTAFCTALLVRDAKTLDGAFTQEGSYLFYPKEQPGFDFLHRTVECTKPVLGLKFFMVLAALGESGMAEYIERQFNLTADVYDYLQSLPDFECPVKPQSNILCFGLKGVDDEHLALRERLLARGDYYISTASLNGHRYLRFTLSNPASGLDEIKGLVHQIREMGADSLEDLMEYSLYVESGPRKRKTMVHVPDLLGCTAQGPTTEAALEATPGAVRAYLRFLQRHGEAVEPKDVYTLAVVEHVMEGPWLGNGNPAPGFGPDFHPLSAAEQALYIQRLSWLRADLLDLVRDLPSEQLAVEPDGGGWSIHRIVAHVGDFQYAYLRAALGKEAGLPPVLRTLREDSERLVPALEEAWSITLVRLEAMTEAERAQTTQRGQVTWTARRMMRRMLEHEWEHMTQISERLVRLPG